MKIFSSEKTHCRIRNRSYDRGETVPQYGVARQSSDGTLEYRSEHSYTWEWSKTTASVSHNPMVYSEEPGMISINFRKKSSPMRVGRRIYSRTYELLPKDEL